MTPVLLGVYIGGAIVVTAVITKYLAAEFGQPPELEEWILGWMGGLLWPIVLLGFLMFLPARWLIRSWGRS